MSVPTPPLVSTAGKEGPKEEGTYIQTRRSDANAPTFDDKEKLATQKSAAAPPLHTGEKRVSFCFSFPLFGG